MKNRIRIAILVMGFSGLVAEILLLRELLIVFSGNELSIGIILANWLILEALGCFFPGRMAETSKNRIELFTIITLLFSLSLLGAILLTRALKSLLGVSIGESIGLFPIFYSSFIILLPVCIFHGALFTFSCQIYSMFATQDAATVGKVYVYETIGTIIGGIVTTYLFVPYFNTFQIAAGVAVLNLVVSALVLAPYWSSGLLQKILLVIQSALALFGGYLLVTSQINELHHHSIQRQWKNLNIVHYQNSYYGNICVIENQGQYIFFQDGIAHIITPVPDMIAVEEFVHLPLLAHPAPAKIMIISDGAGGVISEVLKHPPVKTIDYAELDPLLLTLLRKFPTPLTESELNDTRVRVQYIDGRLWLKTTAEKYDVIFIGLNEPSNLQTNRFFTYEFFTLVKERLESGGILVLGAPGSLTLSNKELKDLNSCIFHTLKSVFTFVRVIPGDGRNIFLASEAQDILTVDRTHIIERLTQREIATTVLVPWHIENKLHYGWQNWFAQFIRASSQEINHDFRPRGLFYSLAHWNALFAPTFGWLFNQFERIHLGMIVAGLALFLLLYFLARSRSTPIFPASIALSIITTGFAGMIFDLVVIFAFQSIYGYVFSWIGLLVASFMAGAAIGAMRMTTLLERIQNDLEFFTRIELAIACFAFGLPMLLMALGAFVDSQSAFVFLLLFLLISFACGLLTGAQFPLANKLYLKHATSLTRTAGLLYASDLLGGWVGGIVGAVMLLPILGLAETCVTVGLWKLTSLIVLTTQPTLN
jgi:spermidine synthase